MKITRRIVSIAIDFEIPFFDVDPMNITWHGNYFKYFEMARCALLEKINYDYCAMRESGYVWPIVDVRVKYVKPTTFKQKIVIEAFLVEFENRIKIEYLIFDKISKEVLTKSHSIQVAIDLKTQEMCYATPKILHEKLQPYICETL